MAEANQATPSELRYSDIPAMSTPSANMTVVKLIPSTGSTYGGNGNCRIPINIPTDSFCDFNRAYLKFTVTNKSQGGSNAYDKAIYLDPQGGISCAIDRFQVISGTGSQLSETNHYNAWCALMNTHMMPNYVDTTLNITEGTSKNLKSTKSFGGVGKEDAALLTDRESVADGATATFVHRPKDPVFNTNRLFPIGFLSGIPYISLTFASTVGAFRTSKAATAVTADWEIKDVELHLPVIQLPSDFNQSFRSLMASGVPISIASTGVVNSQQNLASGSSVATSTFSVRKRNVRGFLLMAREQTNLENKDCDSASCRRSMGLKDYQFSIGGVRMPSAPLVVTDADQGGLLMESKKALGHMSHLHGVCANKSDYYINDEETSATETTETCQKSIFALDTQPYTDNEQLSGMNLSGQGLPVVFHANLDATKGAQKISNLLLDLYSIHDIMYICDGVSGTISASS
jgi:hypothetical protein